MTFVVAALAMLIAIELGARAWDHARLLYSQGQCFNATLPPDTVVFSNNPPASYVDQRWLRFADRMRSPANACETLFVHERIAPAGNHRLVVVVADTGSGRVYPVGRVFVPGSVTSSPVEVLHPQLRDVNASVLNEHEPLTIYAGQPDPADGSHFTIRALAGGRERIIDGWLRDDDTLALELRPDSSISLDAPATLPSAQNP